MKRGDPCSSGKIDAGASTSSAVPLVSDAVAVVNSCATERRNSNTGTSGGGGSGSGGSRGVVGKRRSISSVHSSSTVDSTSW